MQLLSTGPNRLWKVTKERDGMSQLVDMIDYKAKRKGYTPEQMAVLIRAQPNTYFRRKREPEMFRVYELQQIAKRLNIRIVIDYDGTVKAEGEL